MKKHQQLNQMLEAYDVPAILVSTQYEILASNARYRESFGEIDLRTKPSCYEVSHGYNKPCDQSGEHCPLQAAKASKHKESVLHIHQTRNGREHIDVEMIPIFDEKNKLAFFVELLKPIPLASGKTNNQKMVGLSAPFKKMLKDATRVANTEASVLLLGESGVGKELISQTIHMSSKRSNKPLITLECAGLSETLIESELFGHKKGAFTDANSDKRGLVEYADGGTLFLDEIGDVSLTTQVKLLRLIESKTYRRVGSTEVKTSNFRLICATNHNLANLVEQGQFRLDLFHRINVYPIYIPSLKERQSDIPALVEHLLILEDGDFTITPSALSVLKNHDFKGNIRELKNIITRATIYCETGTIDEKIIHDCLALDATLHTQDSPSKSLKQLEAAYLRDLMMKHHHDKLLVAEEADVSLRTLYRKLEQYQLLNKA